MWYLPDLPGFPPQAAKKPRFRIYAREATHECLGESTSGNIKIVVGKTIINHPGMFTLWWTNIAIENDHRNSGFSH